MEETKTAETEDITEEKYEEPAVVEDTLGPHRKINTLCKSESWYMQKFRDYEFPPEFGAKSESMKQVHQERKKQEIINDLDEMG